MALTLAFDAKRAFHNRSGLGNYSRNILDGLSSKFPETKKLLFSPKGSDLYHVSKGDSLISRGAFSLPPFLWRSFSIPALLNELNADVYHGLSNELPFNIVSFKGKKIVTIHDVIFRHFPQWYPASDRFFYDLKTKASCKNADVIVAISRQTANDLMHFYKVPERKIVLIPQPVADHFFDRARPVENMVKELGTEFLLYVGTIEPRKDLLTLLEALVKCGSACLPLVVVGRKTEPHFSKEIAPYIEKMGLTGKVIFPEQVSDTQLASLYRSCKAFIYPSIFEGWGLPVAEALASHAPVITTRGTTMEEAGGDACLYFQPGNSDELAERISGVLGNEALRLELKQKAAKRSVVFQTSACIQQLMDLYIS